MNHYANLFQTIGLIADIFGASLLFLSTEKLNKVVIDLLKHYQHNSSGFDRKKISVEKIQKFDEARNVSNFCAKAGLILIIVGFFLQLVSTILQR